MFFLRLFVMGLIVLVPSEDGKNFTLVLQQASHRHGHLHFPVLVCDPWQSTCRPHERGHEGQESGQWSEIVRQLNLDRGSRGAGFILAGEHLTIEGARRPGKILTTPGPQRGFLTRFLARLHGAHPRRHEDAAAASWVPLISSFDDRAGTIDDTHLVSPHSEDIAALLRLDMTGALMSYHFPVIRSPRRAFVHSFTFKKQHKIFNLFDGLYQATPDVLLVQIPIDGDKAYLKLKGFSATGASTTRELVVSPLDGRTFADVLLGNLAPLPKAIPGEFGVDSPVEDFALYYDLSEGGPPLAEAKVPHVGADDIDANRLMRDIPSVLRLVSRRDGSVGGLDRPVCTKTSMTASSNNALLALATTEGTTTENLGGVSDREGTEAPSQAALGEKPEQLGAWTKLDSLERVKAIYTRPPIDLIRVQYYFTPLVYRPRFRPYHDRIVLSWPSERASYMKSLLESVPALMQEDGFAIVSARDMLAWKDYGDWAAKRPAGVEVWPAYVDRDDGTIRYFLLDQLRTWSVEGEGFPRYTTTLLEKGLNSVTVSALGNLGIGPRKEPGEIALGRVPAVSFVPSQKQSQRRRSACEDPDGMWGRDKIHAPGLRGGHPKGEGVVVAVVDTGAHLSHELLVGHIAEQPADDDWDFADPMSTEPKDRDGHGTHVAGIIACIAPKSEIMPLRVDVGAADDESIVKAIEYVAEQARAEMSKPPEQRRKFVLNMSWVLGVERRGLQDAVRLAQEAGVLMVAAAGNQPHDLRDPKEYPAVYDEVEAVAATYDDDVKTFDSNYGSTVDLSAPGWGITSAWIDDRDDQREDNDLYRRADGTSVAAAHVSGAAALVWSQYPRLAAGQIRAALEYGADITVGLNVAGLQHKLGRGRVNVERAGELASRMGPPPVVAPLLPTAGGTSHHSPR